MRHTSGLPVRPALLTIGVLGATVLLAALGTAQNGAPPPSMAGKTAAQQFKNIKVLKKLPADQLVPQMHVISTSLGVRCGFCHEGNNYASDAKHTKLVARQMMVMTMSLNAHQRIIDHKATCYMCHHGHESPETSPGANPEEGGGPPPPP